MTPLSTSLLPNFGAAGRETTTVTSTKTNEKKSRLLVINDPSVSVRHLIEEARFGGDESQSSCGGMYLQRVWVEDDEISQEIDKEPCWTSLEIVSCQGSRLGNLAETALRQENMQKFALRKMASRLEDCMRAVRLQGFKHLTELTLEVALSERSCLYLASALDSKSNISSVCSLRRLYLERCSFLIPAALTAFARGLKYNATIETLTLTKCKLRDDDLQVLIPNLPCSLRYLDLTDNYCRTQLLPLLNDSNVNLQSLNMTNQHPGEFGGSLDLSQLRGNAFVNTTLIDLDLSFNMLSLNDIRGLMDALETNSTLHSLNLMSNQLDDAAIQCIGEKMPLLKGLRCLNITANRFGDYGADALCKGLKHNCMLTQLKLPRGFAAEEEIQYLLALNRGGRRLLRHSNVSYGGRHKQSPVSLALWPLVLERINALNQEEMTEKMKASVVFFLLHQGDCLIGRENT